ncbi:hypothetical protein N9O24_00715, partial [bacterium]|nr:hypothetical protein [bacterium]
GPEVGGFIQAPGGHQTRRRRISRGLAVVQNEGVVFPAGSRWSRTAVQNGPPRVPILHPPPLRANPRAAASASLTSVKVRRIGAGNHWARARMRGLLGAGHHLSITRD